MHYLVIGGHARGVGKTALVVDVIRAFPEVEWTAVKISSHGHGAWTEGAVAGEKARDGAQAGPTALLEEETERGGRTDSSRFLAAGARRAFLLRVRPGGLAEGMTLLGRALEGTEYAILESNAVLEFIRPAMFLMVVDPARAEFKESARRFLECADVIVARNPVSRTAWEGLAEPVLQAKPVIQQGMGEPLPLALVSLIRERLLAAMHPRTPPAHLPG